MESKVVILTSGKILATTYDADTVRGGSFFKSLVSEIYRNCTDFNKDIVMISDIVANTSHSFVDVLSEYLEAHGTEDKVIIALAGELERLTHSTGTSFEASTRLTEQRNALGEKDFYNVVWSKHAIKNYSNGNYYVYGNSCGMNFLENYSGEDKFIKSYHKNEQ